MGVPPAPITDEFAEPLRTAAKYPSAPPSAPARSAATMLMMSTGPSPERLGGLEKSGGVTVDGVSGALMTTAAGAAGSRHGSARASDHQAGSEPP